MTAVMVLENSVPERLFSTPETPIAGVSAVRALQLAAGQGMPIYTVTQDNIDTVLPQLQLDSAVINEIENAVNAGNEVTVSKTDIDFYGWVGCGYIVMNPATGEGAYMISGGLSGGYVLSPGYQSLMSITLIFYMLAIGLSAALLGPFALIVVPLLIASLVSYYLTVTGTMDRADRGEISVEKGKEIVRSASLISIAMSALTIFTAGVGGVGSTANEINLLGGSIFVEMLSNLFASYLP